MTTRKNDNNSAQHLAGIFAVKEATMKALGKTGKEQFKKIEVKHLKSGAPRLTFKRSCVSISHDKNTAIAVVIFK